MEYFKMDLPLTRFSARQNTLFSGVAGRLSLLRVTKNLYLHLNT